VTLARSVAIRAALLAAVWWALLEGRTYLWVAALPALAAALGASLVLSPPGRRVATIRPHALPAFTWTFVTGSARGALDVAGRAFHRRVPLDPAFIDYRLGLPPGAPRSLFTAIVSLLPGTLSVRLDDAVLTVHVLDRSLPTHAALVRLERRVGDLFGEEPRPPA
jgi:multicomponent Na+:H+ antiporter subunit E